MFGRLTHRADFDTVLGHFRCQPRYAGKYPFSFITKLSGALNAVYFSLAQYMVCKKQSSLPKAALHMIRFHSFYPWHREGAYRHLMNEDDEQALKDVLAFNPYDLYSKSDARPNPVELRPYYEGLIKKFFPEKINW
jgi:hypothetical protein